MITLDLRGLKCPMPVLRTKKALAGMREGERLTIECTDPLAGLDIPNLARETGDVVTAQGRRGDVWVFEIEKAGAVAL